MQILIVSNTIISKKLSEYLALNKNDIVFSTADKNEYDNFVSVHLTSIKEIEDFISANDVSLGIFFNDTVKNLRDDFLNRSECPILFFSNGADFSLAQIKKFIYKNKIKTPKFGVFEKTAPALEYVQNSTCPVIISSDTDYDKQGFFIADTKDKAKDKIEKLFEAGNRKILLQDYIEGIDYNKYLISDGVNIFDFFETISYFDEFSLNDTNFIKDDIKSKIKNEFMPDILNSFLENNFEFQGIIGLKFLISTKDEIYLNRIENFVSESDFEILKNTLDVDLKNLLIDITSENLSQDKIIFNDKNSIGANIQGEYTGVCANTLNRAIELIEIEGFNKKSLDEGLKLWKR